jgi:hypothetical protein
MRKLNSGNFIKVHKIEQSKTIDEFILPNNFMQRLKIKDIMKLSIADFKAIKDKPLYMIKDEETSFKLEKLLGK